MLAVLLLLLLLLSNTSLVCMLVVASASSEVLSDCRGGIVSFHVFFSARFKHMFQIEPTAISVDLQLRLTKQLTALRCPKAPRG